MKKLIKIEYMIFLVDQYKDLSAKKKKKIVVFIFNSGLVFNINYSKVISQNDYSVILDKHL